MVCVSLGTRRGVRAAAKHTLERITQTKREEEERHKLQSCIQSIESQAMPICAENRYLVSCHLARLCEPNAPSCLRVFGTDIIPPGLRRVLPAHGFRTPLTASSSRTLSALAIALPTRYLHFALARALDSTCTSRIRIHVGQCPDCQELRTGKDQVSRVRRRAMSIPRD